MDRSLSSTQKAKIEFGDFQTPDALAQRIVQLLRRSQLQPQSIVEPTCGEGSLLLAAATAFPSAEHVIGIDINPQYLRRLQESIRSRDDSARFTFHCRDVLNEAFPFSFLTKREPLLVIGNPPWVTNSSQGAIGGSNLPLKSNSDSEAGISAVTGRSNFDVSEWILRRLVCWLNGCHATMAMLCKTNVARKVLGYSWQNGLHIESAKLYLIDAVREFSAAVDACLFVCNFSPQASCCYAEVFSSFEATHATSQIGWRGGELIAHVELLDKWQHLQASKSVQAMWRSGIKHDCANVLEVEQHDGKYRNKLGTAVDLEPDHIFPLVKSSDLNHGQLHRTKRWLIVPNKNLREDPEEMAQSAPSTWKYLQEHSEQFTRRRSRVYLGRPAFSVFGIGDYTFARWKVAVSGLYKRLRFTAVGPFQRRPVVFDDTCYFLACKNELEAKKICAALNSNIAEEFLSCRIFWDTKRPITAKLLRQLDLQALLQACKS